MKSENTQSLFDEILQLSRTCEPALQERIALLYDIYHKEGSEREHLLEQRVIEEIDKRHAHEKVLQNRAKLAALGEMMDAVAHQWKQPLNALSMYGDLLLMDYRSDEVNEGYIERFVENIQDQIGHMVTTIGEFRTFLRPDKEIEPFGLKRCTQSVLLLIHDEMLRNNITVTVESTKEIIVSGIENEFKHLMLNLLSNAKDAFIDNNIQTRHIMIRFYRSEDLIVLEVEDTAGGIPETVIPNIFKPNFTTKSEEKGSGIGLYMSMQIAQKMHGTIQAENTQHGARFQLKIPK